MGFKLIKIAYVINAAILVSVLGLVMSSDHLHGSSETQSNYGDDKNNKGC